MTLLDSLRVHIGTLVHGSQMTTGVGEGFRPRVSLSAFHFRTPCSESGHPSFARPRWGMHFQQHKSTLGWYESCPHFSPELLRRDQAGFIPF
jgi:hypothetical protein